MSIARTHHRFSLADYEQMIDQGILTENDRVELIRGEIIEKMSIGELHAACVKRLNRIFNVRLVGKACVGVQDPVRLGNSEPEPDVALLTPREDDYADGHPEAEDVLLVVEVADSSLEFDRVVKRGIYAENGVVEFWILNLLDRALEVYRQPQADGRYDDVRVLSATETTDIVRLPGEKFVVADFFPPLG
ncbi:Uma2 family endonuclease [Lacipirellula sp.]|uniref:Uma2 family endonuclease n=1 Tax=Lacipirellula sp. TaxID=2691419 RepID=UPI003D0FFFBF